MTAEQKHLIPELFAQALDQLPEERTAFLKQACANNEELYRAVCSLLAHADAADSFLAVTAIKEAAEIIAADPQQLTPHSQLGRYRIIAPAGRGGMGEVYRARDDLQREVAIKILPDQFAQHPERVARFEREAQTLAQLNHPNIAAIYGREQIGELRFLVLEYVQGETLGARLNQKKLSIAEAMTIFRQIADALAATHEAGIIHRDLKPANIMLTPKGQVKLLDFGIARYFRRDQLPTKESADSHDSPHGQITLTHPGVTPGTVAYMSPEQCAGQSFADSAEAARGIDLWAFGLVLYEAITGIHPFKGKTSDDTKQAITSREPDWQALPKNTPAKVVKLLHQCLEKDSQRRLRSAAEAAHLLAEAARPSLADQFADWLRKLNPSARLALATGAALLIISSGLIAYRSWLRPTVPDRTMLAVVVWKEPNEPSSCEAGRSEVIARMLQDRLREVRGLQLVADASYRSDSDRSLPLLMADLKLPNIARSYGAQTVLQVTAQCSGKQQSIKYALVNLKGEQLASGSESDFKNLMVTVLGALHLKSAATNTQISDSDQRYYQALVALDQYASEQSVNDAIRLLEELRDSDVNNRTRINAALGLAHYLKFNLTEKREDKEQAASYCDLVSDSQSPDALLRCGVVLTGLDEYDKAISGYEKVLQQRADDSEAVLGLAETYERKKEFIKAEQLYLQAAEMRRDYWAVYNELGSFYFEQERYKEAADCWQKVTELLPFNPFGYSNLGNALLYQEQPELAIAAYNRSISLQRTTDGYLNLGMALLLNGNCQDASVTFNEGTMLDEEDAELWGRLGDALSCQTAPIHQVQNAWDKAIENTNRKLQSDPDSASLHAQLAEWLAKRGRNKQAMEQIEKALAIAPEEPFSLISAVKVYYLTGRREAALGMVRKSIIHPAVMFGLKHSPELKELRADAVYQSIVEPVTKQ